MSTQQQKTFGFMVFFENMFKNIHKLIFTNVIFFAPLVLWLAIFYFIGEITGLRQMLLLTCAVITSFPFYSGVIAVTRDIAVAKEDINVFKTFLKAVKENGWRFLIYGVLFYLAFWMSFFSISFYLGLAQNGSGIFYGVLIICIIIVVLALFAFYYIPVMSVTYDLTFRHTIKNSFLMAVGEFKTNILTTLGLVCFAAILFSVSIFCSSALALKIFLTVVLLLLFPSVPALIINFGVYKKMNEVITASAEKVAKIDKKIDEKMQERKKEVEVDYDDFSDINIEDLSDSDDYIFHNGKMIKKSVLLRKIKEREENNEK